MKKFNERNKEKQLTDALSNKIMSSLFVKERQVRNIKLWCNIWTEQDGKTWFIRPMLVIKKIWSVFFCVPLTTKNKKWKWYYTLHHQIQKNKVSTVILSQWRTLDKRRFFKYLGRVPQDEFWTIKKLLWDLYL